MRIVTRSRDHQADEVVVYSVFLPNVSAPELLVSQRPEAVTLEMGLVVRGLLTRGTND